MDFQETSFEEILNKLEKQFKQPTDYLSYLEQQPSFQKCARPMVAKRDYEEDQTIVSISEFYLINRSQIPFFDSDFISFLTSLSNNPQTRQFYRDLQKSYEDLFPQHLLQHVKQNFPLECFIYFTETLFTQNSRHQIPEIKKAHQKFMDYVYNTAHHFPRAHMEHIEKVNSSIYSILRDSHEKELLFIWKIRDIFKSLCIGNIYIRCQNLRFQYSRTFSQKNLKQSLLFVTSRINKYGIVPIINQVKHSGPPNAVWVFNKSTKNLSLVANKDISSFQEITTYYGQLTSQFFYSYYGFLYHNSSWEVNFPIEFTCSKKQYSFTLRFTYVLSRLENYNQRQFVQDISDQILYQLHGMSHISKILGKLIEVARRESLTDHISLLAVEAHKIAIDFDRQMFKKGMGVIIRGEKIFVGEFVKHHQEIFAVVKKFRREHDRLN